MKRNWPSDQVRNLAKIVNSMAMVGMIVGDNDMIYPVNVGREQLFAHVRPAIDEHPRRTAFHQYRGARPPVSRIIRVTATPVISDPRHAGRCPAAQDPDFHAAALSNNL